MTVEEKELQLATHLAKVHRGANWFYWIIGLSLVNPALAFANSNTHFLIGLSMSKSIVSLLPTKGLKGAFSAVARSQAISSKTAMKLTSINER